MYVFFLFLLLTTILVNKDVLIDNGYVIKCRQFLKNLDNKRSSGWLSLVIVLKFLFGVIDIGPIALLLCGVYKGLTWIIFFAASDCHFSDKESFSVLRYRQNLRQYLSLTDSFQFSQINMKRSSTGGDYWQPRYDRRRAIHLRNSHRLRTGDIKGKWV